MTASSGLLVSSRCLSVVAEYCVSSNHIRIESISYLCLLCLFEVIYVAIAILCFSRSHNKVAANFRSLVSWRTLFLVFFYRTEMFFLDEDEPTVGIDQSSRPDSPNEQSLAKDPTEGRFRSFNF